MEEEITDELMLAIFRDTMINYEYYDDAFYQFFLLMWDSIVPTPLVENFHIEYLCTELQKASDRLFKRLPKEHDIIINIPPSESKSTIISIMWPAWLWTIDPRLRIISCSYSKDLSMDHASLSKDLINSAVYQKVFGNSFKIRQDANAKAYYKNNKGGTRFAASMGGSVIGKHADVLIYDDYNDPEQMSAASMKKANLFYDQKLSTRKISKEVTLEVNLQQRLHTNDLTAHWLRKKDRIYHIKLPSTTEYEIKPSHLIQFYEDGLMNSKRNTHTTIAQDRTTLGERAFGAQQGQEPVKSGGNIVKRKNLQVITREMLPADIFSEPVYFFADTAYKKKEENDPSGVLVAIKYRYDVYLLDYFWNRWEFPQLVEALKMIYGRYVGNDHNALMCVEAKASGTSVVQELKFRSAINITEYLPPADDKTTRLIASTPVLESNRIFVLSDEYNTNQWVEHFITEVTGFPFVAHDESVDCLNMCIEILIKEARLETGGRQVASG